MPLSSSIKLLMALIPALCREPGTVTSIGSATLILSGTNTYTGATIVSGGTLQAGIATSAFGSNSAVTLANTAGVTLNLNNFSNTIGSLNGGGTTGGYALLWLSNSHDGRTEYNRR